MGRKEAIQPSTDTWSIIGAFAAKFLPDEIFTSSRGTVRGIPEENRLQEFQMTFSFTEVVLPDSIRVWCQAGSRPGMRVTKRRVDAQDPSKGWEAVLDRVVLRLGKVDEQIGSYERFNIGLTSGEIILFSREDTSPRRGDRVLTAYERLLSDCSPMWRLSLRDASFLERDAHEHYKLIS